MNLKTRHISALILVLTLFLSSCQLPLAAQNENNANQTSSENNDFIQETEPSVSPRTATLTPSVEVTPDVTETASASEEETGPVSTADENGNENNDGESSDTVETNSQQSPPEVVGPEDFPEGINPLTGLPAKDPTTLSLPPALISISNFPSSARPQAGLNTSPITFEMTVGEGMTRFLTIFYGQFPEQVSGQTEGQSTSGQAEDETSGDQNTDGDNSAEDMQAASIGPIRSGRLPYEDIRATYSGFLVMASAYSGVAQTLSQTTSIFGSDTDDINSALIDVDQLYQIAQSRAEGYPGSNFNLEGMKFSSTSPEGGQAADKIWVFYSNLNQIQWRYDPELGAYIRYDIKTDGSGEFVMSTDRLTGEPLSKENVIVIFAEHDYQAPTLIDINLTNQPPTKALLFRDGEMHEIFWTTQYGEYEQRTGLLRPMRFVDSAGDAVALKHGQTWVQIVSRASYKTESAISESPFYPVIEEPGTGLWLIRYKGKY